MLVRSRWTSSVIDCRANNGAQTGSENGSDHAMVRPCLRLRMKAARIPNPPAKFDTAKLKTATLEHIRLNLRNAYWKAIAEETERAAACGDTRKLYQMLKGVSHRPARVGEVLLERDGSQIPDPRSSQKAMPMETALQGASQLRSTPEHRILTTTYLHGGNLPL